MAGVPLEAANPAEARLWAALLRDLVLRLVPQPAGAVRVVGSATVDGNLVVAGNAAITTNLSAGGTVSATGTLQALGDLTVGDDASVTDDLAVGGDLTVTGTATASGLLTAAGGVDVAVSFAPPAPDGSAQTNRVTMSTGVPTAGQGSNGDVHVRAGVAGNGTIYRKEGGAWANKL